MSRTQLLAGLWATIVIVFTLGVVAALEPGRMAAAQTRLQENQIVAAGQDYLVHCSGCHGSVGQGTAENPPLDTEGMRGMETAVLTRLITRGVGDVMPPAAVTEGGPLTNDQIAQLALLIGAGGWEQVQARLQAAGNLALYVEHCGGCHGLDGSGSKEGPRLDTRRVRQGLSPEQLVEIIEQGTPDEAMPGFAESLTLAEISQLVNLLRHWDALAVDK